MQSSLTIANYFVNRASESKVPLRPMKLLKLVYLAHGWHLGFTEKPLIREDVQAWQWGPVIPELYHEIKGFRDSAIPADVIFAPRLTEEDALPILTAVWDSYSKYTGAQLSTITHEPGSPWYKVWHEMGGKDRKGAMIPNSLIMEYYKEKAAHVRSTQSPSAAS